MVSMTNLLAVNLIILTFKTKVKKSDISIASETWGCNHAKCLEGYHALQLKPNKLDCVKSGRSSGGHRIW